MQQLPGPGLSMNEGRGCNAHRRYTLLPPGAGPGTPFLHFCNPTQNNPWLPDRPIAPQPRPRSPTRSGELLRQLRPRAHGDIVGWSKRLIAWASGHPFSMDSASFGGFLPPAPAGPSSFPYVCNPTQNNPCPPNILLPPGAGAGDCFSPFL